MYTLFFTGEFPLHFIALKIITVPTVCIKHCDLLCSKYDFMVYWKEQEKALDATKISSCFLALFEVMIPQEVWRIKGKYL